LNQLLQLQNEKHINHLSKKFILYTQKLTAEFCVKYLYNPDIDSDSEDSYIWDMDYILEQQDHISEEEFQEALQTLDNDDGNGNISCNISCNKES
jgi:hypothetical protein